MPAEEVIRPSRRVPALVAGDEPFEIVTHLDYALRYWPERRAGGSAPLRGGVRTALRAVAGGGPGVNTRRLADAAVVGEGGCAISFGDAHTAAALARLPEAMAMVKAFGFRPADPRDLWRR